MRNFCFALIIIAPIACANNITTLPITFFHELPSVPVKIQSQTIKLLFDTGASSTNIALSPRVLKKINVHYLNSKKCFNDVTGRRHCNHRFIISRIKLGSFTLHNVTGTVMPKIWGAMPKKNMRATAIKNGVIGLKLLKHFGILVDYKKKQISLSVHNNFPDEYNKHHGTHIKFRMNHGINIQATIDGVNYSLVLDTGAQPSSLKYSKRIKSQLFVCRSRYEKKCRYIKTKNFMLDDRSMSNTWFHLNHYKIPYDGLLGSTFFKQHTIFIDFSNRKIWISRHKKND